MVYRHTVLARFFVKTAELNLRKKRRNSTVFFAINRMLLPDLTLAWVIWRIFRRYTAIVDTGFDPLAKQTN